MRCDDMLCLLHSLLLLLLLTTEICEACCGPKEFFREGGHIVFDQSQPYDMREFFFCNMYIHHSVLKKLGFIHTRELLGEPTTKAVCNEPNSRFESCLSCLYENTSRRMSDAVTLVRARYCGSCVIRKSRPSLSAVGQLHCSPQYQHEAKPQHAVRPTRPASLQHIALQGLRAGSDP
jgi:hypothetical protein